ncbi:MAG: hypothetical protein AAGG50_07495 [Bacteroidota bacterium]
MEGTGEREEYLGYLGYIEADIEDLELADMQGVRGLHALRVVTAAHSDDALPDDPAALVQAIADAFQTPRN